MTIEQFNATSFSSKSRVIYNAKEYDVYSVDFDECLIGINEFPNAEEVELSWKRCENCELIEPEYEPYFGWCDVQDCTNEGSCGGSGWRESGYWTLCLKHSDDARKGKEQPSMKSSAIERESRRDKDGYLTHKP